MSGEPATWTITERAIEHLRMHALSAEVVETGQLVVLTSELRLALNEIDRLQREPCHACGALRRGIL